MDPVNLRGNVIENLRLNNYDDSQHGHGAYSRLMQHFPHPTKFSQALAACIILMICGYSMQSQASPAQQKQKPPGDLIKSQERPQVAPRVLERATPENTSILIKLGDQRAFLLVDGELAVDTPISSGKRSGMTPKGDFIIVQKTEEQRSNTYGNFVNPAGQVVRSGVSTRIDSAPSGTVFRGAPMKYFMQLGTKPDDYSAVGLHAGQLPGYPSSHGCVRLPEDIAPLIYHRIQLGTPVVIQD